MNGFQALLFSEIATKGLFAQPRQLSQSNSDNNNFFELLTGKTVDNNEETTVSKNLIAVTKQLGEQLELDKDTLEKLISFVQTLIDTTQSIDTIDEQLMENFIIPMSQFLETETDFSQNDVANKILAVLKGNGHLKPILTQQLITKDSMLNFVKQQSSIQSGTDFKFNHLEQVLSARQILQHFFAITEEINFDLDSNIQHQSQTLLKLLGEWQTLNDSIRIETVEEHLADHKKLMKLWDELVSRYSKRTNSLVQSTYHHNSKVDNQDIINWVKHLLPKIVPNSESSQFTQTLTHEIVNPTMQSALEQYVIYTRVADGENSIKEQLINQFRQIIFNSQFSTTHPGINSLSITLKPNNLGEMLVRFVEVNGEMTVKILVTSQATKSILEGNIHQLKHMFAPHQVLIEKVEDSQNLIVKEESFQEDTNNDDHQETSEGHQDEQLADSDELDFKQLLEDYI